MSSEIRFTIEIDDKKYVLPIPPSEIQITSPTGNEQADVIGLGEITILKRRKLRTLQIDSFFPLSKDQYSFCQTNDNFKSAGEYIKAFEEAQINKKHACLTIENSGIKSFYVSIEDFSITQGVTGEISYTLSLKEFRPYGQTAKTLEQNQTLFDWDVQTNEVHTANGKKRPPKSFAIGDHVIVSGDYYVTSTGIKPPVEGPMNFLKTPFDSTLAEVWRNRKDLKTVEPLNAQRCIIIDRDDNRTTFIDLPILGYEAVTTITPYRYHVADLETRKSIGWVAEDQMTRIS